MGSVDKTTSEIQSVLDQQYDGDQAVNGGWDDLATSLIGRRLFSNVGTVDYDYSENAVVFSDGGDISDDNDCVVWNLQKPHGAKTDSTFNMHFHWEQADAVTKEFTLQYRIQSNGVAKETTWTEVIVDTNTNNVFTYTSGTMNQITGLVSVDWSAATLSATVQFRMTRTDSNGGTVNVLFVDGHVERDQERGSRQEYVK